MRFHAPPEIMCGQPPRLSDCVGTEAFVRPDEGEARAVFPTTPAYNAAFAIILTFSGESYVSLRTRCPGDWRLPRHRTRLRPPPRQGRRCSRRSGAQSGKAKRTG